MATFVCRYMDDRRGILEVEVEAESRQSAISQIRTQGRPISVEEKVVTLGSKEISLYNAKKIKLKDISLFCKQMSVMLESGIPLNNAVDIMEQQATSKVLRESLKKVSNSLKEGNQLSTALRQQGSLYPELLINMIEAGERTGRLDNTLERMSTHYTKELKINRQVKGALIYPAVLIFLVVAAVIILMTFVIPQFKGVFDSSGVELPLITRMVLGMSEAIVKYWWLMLIIIIGLVVGVGSYIKTDAGRYQFDALKLKLPLIKGAVQKIITSRFSSTMATLTSSGIPLVDAIEAAASTTNNAVVEARIKEASGGLQQGRNLTEMITATGIFPPMMLSMVKIGEESGSLESMLVKTSDYYEEELEAAIKQLLSLMEPALIIVMGVIVGGIVASVFFPLFGLAGAIEQGAGN